MKQEDEDEYPVAEDPGDEGDSDELKAMKSQLDAMKKQLEAYESGMQKAIQDESENRLRKMGFAESTTLKAPASLMNLGTDDVAPIQKGSDSSDFMEDLNNVSYGELLKLQHQIEMGETDGLPRELIGG